ncbi:MAG: glycosyltransferase [Selenomonas sp.]|jgi:glycosyltransferase involved in cell wall biosynthesis|nr:glycosyltransferase [Selenomonas sp.]
MNCRLDAAYQCIVEKYGESKLPLVSVMIPTYNRPELFEQTLQSACQQTYPNIEIIICDNSTDERTAEIMQCYLDDPRIQYHRNREAKTKAENFQPFEQLARGEFLQWLMDDDLLEPDKTTRMLAAFAEHPGVRLATSNRRWIDLEGRDLEHPVRLEVSGNERDYALFSGQELGRLMLCQSQNYIGEPSAVLFRRKDLQHHYWQADCRGYQVISDVVMWLELMEKGDCAYFREPLSSYRRHNDQEGQSPVVILRSRVEWFRIIAEYYEKNMFLSSLQDFRSALSQLIRDADSVHQHPLFQQPEIQQTAEWNEYQELLKIAREIVAA